MKILLLALAVILLTGCKDPYGASSKVGKTIGTAIAGGFQTIALLEQQGTISRAEALDVAGYLEYANKGDEAFLSCVKMVRAGGSTPSTYSACAQIFDGVLNNPANLALIHVENAQASQTIRLLVNGFAIAMTTLEASLGGA